MAACNVKSVQVQPEAKWSEEMVFSVVLDVASDLPEDITCKCFFTMDAWDLKKDTELEACDIGDGPGLTKGLLKFDLPVRAPSKFMIEAAGVLEVTAMYISFIYRGTEFHRTGYYVRHEYDTPELQETPPADVDWDRLQRVLSAPRIVSYPIDWGLVQDVQAQPEAEERSPKRQRVDEGGS
mmetsp:Transcript_43389/g.99991  ORF Transcript_43389/g.99991 Transcript_43389/m.99991 type:complete len:181 (+) Transcript_43389:54-596(+)